MVLGSALLETLARAYFQTDPVSYRRLLLSRLLFAVAFGLLLPLAGATILVLGEAALVVRLFVLDRDKSLKLTPAPSVGPAWREGFRNATSKWGLSLSMIFFTLTLKDRVAEIGAGISLLIWLAVNRPYSIYPIFGAIRRLEADRLKGGGLRPGGRS